MNKKNNKELFGIIGLGRFGFALAQTLSEAGKEVLAVDSSEDKIKAAAAFVEHAYTVHNITKDTLEEIGMQNCDVVIVCIGEQIDMSILTALNVISMGVKRVIAKAISAEQGCVLQKIGAEVVYPERDMAIRLANRLVSSKVMEYISLNEDIDITEIHLTKRISGVSVYDMDLRKKFGLNIIALKRDSEIIIEISSEYCFHEDDVITVIGKKQNIQRFAKYLEG